MPVSFVKGDILGYNVDAVVIPRAPNDKMPWNNYDEIDFWDITVDVFSRANMKKMVDKYNLNRGNGYKIGEDFTDEEDAELGYIKSDKYPEITVTKFCELPVNCVFHVCVVPYTSYLCITDDYNACAAREEYMLRRCYWMTLSCAARLGIKKIAFPLFSTDCPKEIAYAVAHTVPQKWLDEKTEYEEVNDPSCGKALNRLKTLRNKHNAEMEIYIVEPGRKDMLRMEKLRNDPSEQRPYISEFECRLEREMSAFNGSADAFRLNFIQMCFEKYIKGRNGKYSALAEKAHYGNSDITKLKNGGTKKVRNKKTAIALAVAMELSAYERFAFINCTKNKYPADETDLLIERLISEGKRDITELNEALIKINEAYDLFGEG